MTRSLTLLLPLALPLAAGCWQDARAQKAPLTADPARAIRTPAYRQATAQRRPTSLSLPFFDDFADERFGSQPNPALWEPTGAFRNETFASKPPSHGTVTFDGLDANGRAYGTPAIGATDTLTSLPIDLSGRTDVVLSFWVQAGGIANIAPPDGTNQYLTLDFDDGTGIWEPEIWKKTGPGTTTAFEQIFVPVPAIYISNNFRFRFRAHGSQIGSINIWSIDYVELDANRQPQARSLRDVALSQALNLPLKRYAAMPVWQYNAATNPTDELADSVHTTVNNFDISGIPTPLSDFGSLTTRVGGVATRADQFLNEPRVIPSPAQQLPLDAPFRAGLPATPIDLTPDYKTITSKVYLASGELTPETLANDTLRRTATLANYYAHDDGSPELAFNFKDPGDPSAVCIPYEVNTPDQVAGVELYIAGGVVAGTRLLVDVWADSAGRPAHTALRRTSFTMPTEAQLLSSGPWWALYFAPVPVTGRFYVGYSLQVRAASIASTSIGQDMNVDSATVAGQTFFRSASSGNIWTPLSVEDVPGWLMIHAIMNQNGLLGAAKPVVAANSSLSVYPNPVSASGAGVVRLSGNAAARGSAQPLTLTDAVGRLVLTLPAGTEAVDIHALSPGVYVLRQGAGRGVRVLVTE